MLKVILLILAIVFFILLYLFIANTADYHFLIEYTQATQMIDGESAGGGQIETELVSPLTNISIEGVLKGLSLFFLMLLGILSNQLYELFKKKHDANQAVSLRSVWKEFITGARLWMAVFISPLLFFATYFVLKDTPDNIVAMFYSYQNGFFWYSLTNMLERRFTGAINSNQ